MNGLNLKLEEQMSHVYTKRNTEYWTCIEDKRLSKVTLVEDPPQTKRRWRTREAVLARIKEIELENAEARNA